MAYNITFKQSVWKDLKKLHTRDAAHILDKIEEELPNNADQYPALTGKFAGLRNFRIGQYRVIYALQHGSVLILRVGHRRDVYR